MMTEILGTLVTDNDISVFGFGSFFRSGPYKDIDLLFVFSGPNKNLLATSKTMREICRVIQCKTGEVVHPIIVTDQEFKDNPLRDMDELVRIR